MDAFLARAAEAYAFTYFGALLALALVEWIFPRRRASGAIGTRWMGNVGVALLDALVLRLLFPAAGVAWAVACDARGWGVFNQATIPAWSGIVVSIAALDFITYAQHWLLHRIPLLWRMHLTHHTDQEIAHILNERDETTLRRRGRPDSRRLQGIEVFRRAACRKQPTSAPRGLSAYLAWWCGCHDPAC